jgi:hypothetical protein
VNTRVLAFVIFFAALMVAPKIVEPAYYFFLVAFAFVLGLQGEWRGIPLRLGIAVNFRLLIAAFVVLTILTVTYGHAPAARDVLRDVGAMFAFFVGRFLFVAYREKDLQFEALEALSAMGVMVSIVTIFAALAAYLAGVSAYIWRGEYVPWAHTWIPFALVANVFLSGIDPAHARRWRRRAALCVLATIASLSRTDLLLEFGFGLVMLWSYRRELLLRFAGFVKVAGLLAVLAILAPIVLQVDVVQQRLERGVGEGDQSLGWRFMENIALVDHFLRGSTQEIVFGFGLGARLPLPPGVVDFNNNTTIPTLHNSFGTIALKLGALGLVILFWYLWRTMRRSFSLHDAAGAPYRRAGRWIVLLCLGKALTLHGLTEWSHAVFFGIGCMLMLNHAREAAATTPTETPEDVATAAPSDDASVAR